MASRKRSRKLESASDIVEPPFKRNVSKRQQEEEELNYHANWDLGLSPDSKRLDCTLQELDRKLKSEIEENPQIKCKAYLFLAYAWIVGDKTNKFDFDEAKKHLLEAQNSHKGPGDKFLLEVLKFFCQKEEGDLDATRRSRDAISQFLSEEKTLSDHDKAVIFLAKGFALDQLGHFDRALDTYRESCDLDPDNAEAQFCVGLMLGKIRRESYGPVCEASKEEIDAFKKAMQLDGSNPRPFAFYARAHIKQLRKLHRNVKETLKNIENILHKIRENKSLRDRERKQGDIDKLVGNLQKAFGAFDGTFPPIGSELYDKSIRNGRKDMQEPWIKEALVGTLEYTELDRAVTELDKNCRQLRKTITEMDECLNLAIKNAERSYVVFTTCAKAYRDIGKVRMSKEDYNKYTGSYKDCVEKALQLSQEKYTPALHEGAIFYCRIKEYHNFEMALELIKKAIDFSPNQTNIWADIERIRIQHYNLKENKSITIIKELKSLAKKYEGKNNEYEAVVFQYIAKEYEQARLYEDAMDYCYRAAKKAENMRTKKKKVPTATLR